MASEASVEASKLEQATARFHRAIGKRVLPDLQRSTLALTPDPSASPATPVENFAVHPADLLAGLRAGPSLLTSLIAYEVLGPPLALRPSGEPPRGVW